VSLADGNQASVGDLIITRSNDRRLRLTATDWVKNGDRWTITRIGRRSDLIVRHTRSHRTVRLPAGYVHTSTGLGYATTIHSAQGVTVYTMHGLAAGQESRQQLYTMLTRGRAANHLYLQVVGDGDPHTVIRPETLAPALRASCSNRFSPATTPPPPPPASCENSTIRQPGSTRPSSATPTASMSRLGSASDLTTFICWTAKPTRSSPNSRANHPGPPSEHTSSRWRLACLPLSGLRTL
jgi:hypothetical protein